LGVARATLTREDSEWSRKFEELGQERWDRFFCQAASKGLPRPFDAAGWRCPKGVDHTNQFKHPPSASPAVIV
jgi:hypothetical protein